MNEKRFQENGFFIIDNAFDEQIVDNLKSKLAQLDFGEAAKQRENVAFGVRNLLNIAPVIKDFANSESVNRLIKPFAGEKARIIRAIYFDKTPEANWKVPFHQDLTIAVKSRKEVEGFTAWTTKAGILHVQPPVSILENIVALRVHLDKTDEANGALRVVCGSHLFGRLNATEIRDMKNAQEIVTCNIEKGGAMLMRPLLLHASSSAINVSHRRVLHFEFSSEDLPRGLDWFGS